MMRSRTGAALLETLIAAIIAALVVAAATLLLHAQTRAAHTVTHNSERSDAARTAWLVLQAEWQNLAPSLDVRAIARDSITSRIFRGVAVVCGYRGGSTIFRYRGLRLPDPAKDSALQVGLENTTSINTFHPDTAACAHAPGEQVFASAWNTGTTPGSMWLLFESGGYHLSDRALRYRLAGSTRQPVSNQVLDDRQSAFIAVRDSLLRAVDVLIAESGGPARAHARIHLLNSQ